MTIHILEDTRLVGGLHPIPVLALRDMLQLMWFPPIVAVNLAGSVLPFGVGIDAELDAFKSFGRIGL
jgi:hypothetical protein